MDGCGDIATNDEAIYNFYIVCFEYVPYTLQEDMESDGNKLSYGDLVCNNIYTSTVWPKLIFYIDPCKRKQSVTVSVRTVAIPNIEVDF